MQAQIVLMLSVLAAGGALAQQTSTFDDTKADQRLASLRESTLDASSLQGVRARDAIRITAGAADSAVSIKASTKLEYGGDRKHVLSLTASAPLAKGQTDGDLLSRGGLTSGTTLTLGYGITRLFGTIDTKGNAALAACEELKRSVKLKAQMAAMSPAPELTQCDTDKVKELVTAKVITDAEYLDYRALLFDPGASVQTWEFKISGGYRDAKWYDATTLARSERRRGLGAVGLSYVYMPLEAEQLFAGTLSLESSVKDAKSSTACLPAAPAGNPLLSCATGAIGAPERVQSQVLDLEWRRKISGGRYAMAVLVSRDFKEKVTSVKLPLYLVGNDSDGLTGGISIGWSSDDKKARAAVFVGKAFSTQP